MGCCIIGALIISRWLYALRRARLSVASLRTAVAGLLRAMSGNRRAAILSGVVAAEMALLAALTTHELTAHAHLPPALTHESVAVAAIDMDAICSTAERDR